MVLNIQNGPLESLRRRPEFGRLGELLDSQSRTGRVRELIWMGASDLVRPHEPLEFPDGRTDPFNVLRPLIGYGPESMYVAYNPFYPSDLTQVEKRNASPDRSHNETWDSLVITGVLGLAAYLVVFGSILYYGLKWLGMVRSKRQRNLFLVFYLLGGTLSVTVFVLWKGIHYLGVALPFGMILGVILYLILVSLFGHVEGVSGQDARLRVYLLLGLLGGIMAHFVEINFGIAIAATRTYFWTYAALLLAVGYILPLHREYRAEEAAPASVTPAAQPSAHPAAQPASSGGRGRTGRDARPAAQPARRKRSGQSGFWGAVSSGWLHPALVATFILAVLLSTLGYEYVSNISRKTSALELIWASLTSLGNKGGQGSFGILSLLLTTWVAGGLLLISESFLAGDDGQRAWAPVWLKMAGTALGLSFLLALTFWLWHAGNLAALGRAAPANAQELLLQVQKSEGLLTVYYTYLLSLILAAGLVLPVAWPQNGVRWVVASQAVGLGLLVVALALGANTNLRVIQADMAFKAADLFARPGSWPIAIDIYNRANKLASNEDYYYLFLGRAYLEHAKSLQDPTERDAFIDRAARDLVKAQQINPLNTDHTANLARLYSLWASFTTDPARRDELAKISGDYFAKAVVLSPNNSRLWDEWAVLYLNILNQPQEAFDRLQKSLEIDPYYDWTYAMLGDYYSRFKAVDPALSDAERQEALVQSSENYRRALELLQGDPNMRSNYLLALGSSLMSQNDLPGASAAYEEALQATPDTPDAWRILVALAQMASQQGDNLRALEYAQRALERAPEEQKPAIQSLIAQLGG